MAAGEKPQAPEHATYDLSNTATSDDIEALHDRMDGLWIRYLNLVDQYQEAQEQLAKRFSSGFFSLAQANFKSPSRIRYGQDYYDERMRATGRVQLASHDGQDLTIFIKTAGSNTERPSEKAEPGERNAAKLPTPRTTPAPKNESAKEDDRDTVKIAATLNSSTDETSKPGKLPTDPLHWFGILIPRELRSAQSSFAAAVSDPMAAAVNAARGMRDTEALIRKLRKAIRKTERVQQPA